MAVQYFLLISRQGKVRLSKWYQPTAVKEKAKIVRELSSIIIARSTKSSNVIDYRGQRVVLRRYASLYFVAAISPEENELLALETIHLFVEVLDKYFGNVCELDLIFNFHKAYLLLDEVILNGELQDTSKKAILKYVSLQESVLNEASGRVGGGPSGVVAINYDA